MNRILVYCASIAMTLAIGACSLFESDSIHVSGIGMYTEDELTLSIIFRPCPYERTTAEVQEFTDRIEIDIKTKADDSSDCLGATDVALINKLGNRVVIIINTGQSFEDCNKKQLLCEIE